MACHHRPWTGNTIKRRRAWHAITALGQHTRSDDIGRGMPSSPLGSTHGRTMSGCQDITAFGKHTRSNDIRRGMTSPPLDNTHGRTTSGVACHHRLRAAQMVERHRAWHPIIAFGQHARSDDVGRDMPSLPLDNTHGQMTTSVACHHPLWAAHTVELRRRCIPLSPLGSTNGRTTSGVACQHRLWAAHTVKRRPAWMTLPPLDSTYGRTT